MYNPWIFRQVASVIRGEEPYQPSLEDKRVLLLHFIDLMAESMPTEMSAIGKVKQLCGQYTRGLPNGSHFREDIFHSHKTHEIVNHINRYFDNLQSRGYTQYEESQVDVAELEQMTCEA